MVIAGYEIVDPYYLYLLLIIPLILTWQWFNYYKQNGKATFSKLPSFVFKDLFAQLLPFILNLVKVIALACLIIALSRPRKVDENIITQSIKGIDIVMCVDVSGSMLAKDLKPSRLEALKKVAIEFVNKRPTDRFALVSFSGESFTNVPMTSDKGLIISAIKNLEFGLLESGTAIGVGLANAVKRLEHSDAESKIVIFLTDGKSTGGFIEPLTSAKLAKDLGIKIYTIGVGTRGLAESPVGITQSGKIIYQVRPVEIDDDLLTKVAEMSGGKYFRATDNNALESIYDEINTLEKTEIDEKKYYTYQEYYYYWIGAALILLMAEFLFRKTLIVL